MALDPHFGYDPTKLKYAQEFCKGGINTKTVEELIEAFNYIFNKQQPLPKCNRCALQRYRNIIVNYLTQGTQIYKSHNMNIEEEIKKMTATEEDILALFEPKDEPETKPVKKTRKKVNKDEENK